MRHDTFRSYRPLSFLLFAGFLFTVLSACTTDVPGDTGGNASADPILYTHPTLGYTLQIPASWEGTYAVTEELEDGIDITSFDYIASEPRSFVFRIAAYPRDVWNAMLVGPDQVLNTEAFARTDTHIYAAIRTLDNPYQGANLTEYGGMTEDIDAIIDSFDLTGSEPYSFNPLSVYYANEEFNTEADCSAVYPVLRDVSDAAEEDQPEELLEQLFAGPNEDEQALGYSSFFSEETDDLLLDLIIRDGTAYVNIDDIREELPNVSSSCGSAAFVAQIESTLRQFPDVERVIIAIDGRTQDFYDWIQVGCAPENDNCDDTPFSPGA